MKMKKRILLILIAVVLLTSACTVDNDIVSELSADEKTQYTVEVKTQGGMPLSDVLVYVYRDSSKNDLVWAGETDEEGKISFQALVSQNFVAVLQELPQGYVTQDVYSISNDYTSIIVESVLLGGTDLFNTTYKLGDVFGDFVITSVDGTEYKISELLQTKKAIVLNFWFINCGPCKMEFPYLQQTYEEYQNDIEVLALNPLDGTDESVLKYAQDLELTFPMSACDSQWQTCMQLTAYPTTVIIDRYGTIAMIHRGSITEKEVFANIFDYFTSEGYQQTKIRNISEIQ